jgi:flagellar biosynthetic protein FliO
MTQKFAFACRQIFRTLPFFALLTMAAHAAQAEDGQTESKAAAAVAVVAPIAVEKVRAFRDGDTFTAEFQTATAWNGADVSVQYFKDSIQVDITGAFLSKGKQLIKVEDRAFKSVYATQFDATTVRARFTVKPGFTAKSFAGRLHAKRGSSTMTFEVTGDAGDAKTAAAKVSDEPRTLAVVDENTVMDSMPAKLIAGIATTAETDSKTADAKITEALGAASTAASTVAIGGDAKADAAAAAGSKKIDSNKLPENEIPVLSAAKAEKKSESNPFFKIIMTLAVVATALGAAAFGVKKLAGRTGKKGLSTRINVLTTHHLGPKKNLMIVQVAGETLLIGVTDHNISMLKTLALIDDEIPASVPQRFDHSMEDFIGDEDEPIAMRGLDQIRDTVSTRLKNMRNI